MANIANVASTVRETLVADRPSVAQVAPVITERMVGNAYGYTAVAFAVTVVREVLTKEATISIGNTVREIMASIPNDGQTQPRIINGLIQGVVQLRPKMPLPSTVRSPIQVASYREQVVQRATRIKPRSANYAATLRESAVIRRFTVSPANTHSPTTANSYVQQVVQSRNRAYVPVSMVYAMRFVEQVAQRRTMLKAPNVRSQIRAGRLVEQVVQSRVRAPVVITTYAFAGTLAQQVVLKDTRPKPHSMISAKRLAAQVVQQYVPLPPGSDTRVYTLVEQAVARYVPAPRIGMQMAGQVMQQALIERISPMPRSPLAAAALRQMIVVHRDTYPPRSALGRHTASLREQVVLEHLVPRVQHSVTSAGSLRLIFVLRQTVPRPIDVIDPAIGRHAYSLRMLTVQRRITAPPGVIARQSIYTESVAEVVVVGDTTFPPPEMPDPVVSEQYAYQVAQQVALRDPDAWTPVSRLTVQQVASVAVVGDADAWIDATIPQSQVSVFSVAQALAVGDVFRDPAIAASDAEVAMVGQSVVVGDNSLPDPRIPASEVRALTVAEFAALGDTQFPNPMIPLSEVRSSSVASSVVILDPSLHGNFGMSEITVPSVLEFAVIRDPSLVGIPIRTGPRPTVTVSMS